MTKVGAIVLATNQGLGYLAKDFFDHGIIHKVYIHEHSSRRNNRDWYPRESVVSSPEILLEECDTLLFFETPFEWKIIPKAREKGIKTVLMVMYECTRYPLTYQPDIILSPSKLDKIFYPESVFLPIPVSKNWQKRSVARIFIHNAGNGGIGGRNGTKELLEAMEYVKSPITLIIRSQIPISILNDPRIDLRVGTFDDIWSEGDIFIFPEKFNGLSLPLQEAFASGMAVMATDRFPMNDWLPKDLLIPVSSYKKEKIAVEFDMAVIDPKTIAKKIDEWFDKDIEKYSEMGRQWGVDNSWQNLQKEYVRILSNERHS